jgi:hypothetical protein
MRQSRFDSGGSTTQHHPIARRAHAPARSTAMPDISIPTAGGAEVVDSFDDDDNTSATDVPPHLDEETLAFVAKIQAEARRAVADAEHATAERIAADFERMAKERSVLMAPGAAAARVRSLAWARSAA